MCISSAYLVKHDDVIRGGYKYSCSFFRLLKNGLFNEFDTQKRENRKIPVRENHHLHSDEVRRALRDIRNIQFILSLVLLFRFSLLKIFTGQIDQDPPGNFALYGWPFHKRNNCSWYPLVSIVE